MSLLRPLARGLRALFRPRQTDGDVADEVRDYLERATAAHLARGLSPQEARRAARLEVGDAGALREQVRASGWEHGIETTVLDVLHALRRLRASPTFAITAVATLAVGIGASTAVFSVASPILLEPLPFPHARRLVTVDDRSQDGVPDPATLGTYEELQARAHSFEALAAADPWRPSLTGTGHPERLDGERVTAGYFGVFGAAPAVGRGFTAADARPGAPEVAILSAGLAERRFGGARAVVGRTVEMDGDPYLVVGVMPRGFTNVIATATNVWSPLREKVTADFSTREWGHHYQLVARLAPGATVASAAQETVAIGRAPVPGFPRPSWADLAQGMVVRPLLRSVTGYVRTSLFAIIGAVLLLLAIASVNVTNLLLARGAQRRPELAMRLALGASRRRLVRQLVTESLVLALLGGALGLGLAHLGVHALVSAGPPGLPRVQAIRLDAHVFVFALALTALVGVLVGLAPAMGVLRSDVTRGWDRASRRTTTGPGGARNALVVAEMALALVLLVSAGLLLRSVRQLMAVAPGFDPSHVLTMQVVEAGHEFASDTVRLQFLQQALDAVRGVPGVSDAAFTSQLPLSGDVDGYGYAWASRPEAKAGEDGSALRYAVTPSYFKTMGIPLVRGRLLDAGDRPGGPEAVVINESFARRLFGTADPLGERVRFGPETEAGSQRPWDVVVGVVGDVKQYSLAVPAPDAFYVANGQWDWVDNVETLVVRASGDLAALAPAVQRAVWSVSSDVPIVRVETMGAFVSASAGQRRFALLAIGLFALAAVLLASVGLYGVIAGSVTERTREIGIRTALGAAPGDVVRRVVGQALSLTALGAVIGLGGAYAASRLLAAMLFGVSRLDPATYLGVLVLLAAVAQVAAWAPARRAARVDPTISLRAE